MKYMACLVMLLTALQHVRQIVMLLTQEVPPTRHILSILICLQYQEVLLHPVQKLILQELPIHGRAVLKKRT